jgi:prolipoprotein diacylglyceryl transferase
MLPAYIHWNVDPTLFRLGPLAPRWYGLLFASGFLIGFYIMRGVFMREGKPERDLDALLLYLLGGTVIGARLGHILFYAPTYYFQNPLEIPQIWEGGLASHGGLIGVPLAVWLYARSRDEQPFLWLLDRLSVPIALTGAFIRLGNLFNSEILGVRTDVAWAFVFERVDDVPRHPAQLYESIAYFGIFLALRALYKRRGPDLPQGLLTGWFLVGVFGIRSIIELVKVRQAHFPLDVPLSMGQLLSLPVIAVGAWLLVRAYSSAE